LLKIIHCGLPDLLAFIQTGFQGKGGCIDGGLGFRIPVTAALHCPPSLVAMNRVVGFLRTTFFSVAALFDGLPNSFFLGPQCLPTFFLRPFRLFVSVHKRFVSGVEVANMGLPCFRAQLVSDRDGT